LLSVLWRIKRRLGEYKSMLFWLASQIRVNRLMPELLNAFPVFDLTSTEEIADLMCLLCCHSFLSDVIVQLIGLELRVFLQIDRLFMIGELTLLRLVAIVLGII
jgi:hypothetical protein